MKGVNLRIAELRTNLADVINVADLPVGVTTMILSEILGGLKSAELRIIESERKQHEKALEEEEVKNG